MEVFYIISFSLLFLVVVGGIIALALKGNIKISSFSGNDSDRKIGQHVLVKTDYRETAYGPWPRWECSCGKSDYVVCDWVWYGEQKALREFMSHARKAHKNDVRRAKSGQDYMF